jgi:heme oxygenase (biliverdin-IX-beta and delta-forming)
MTTTILMHLKHATRNNHARLEQHPLLHRLRDPQLSLDEYGTILRILYGFYAPVEARLGRIADWTQRGLALEERRKSPLLRHDLRALNQRTLAPTQWCNSLPELKSVPFAIGCLYVLEGATLGGQIIARDVQRHLGLHAMRGTAFFSGYGPATGAMWRTFGQFVAEYAAPLPDDAAIIAGANATFVAFEHWLNARSHVALQE